MLPQMIGMGIVEQIWSRVELDALDNASPDVMYL